VLESIDYVLLFITQFLAFALVHFMSMFYLKTKIVKNDLQHIAEKTVEEMISMVFKKSRAYKGVDARQAKKQSSEVVAGVSSAPPTPDKWKQFENIVGSELSMFVSMLPETQKNQLVDAALKNPGAAKFVISMIQGAPGGPPAQAPGQAIEFVE